MARFFFILSFTFCLVAFPVLAEKNEPPKVVASIEPLGSLVAAVMEGVAPPPAVLIDGMDSEHIYTLKPSQARLIKNADLVVIISENYEHFLKSFLKGMPQDSLLFMADQKGMTLWERKGDAHDHGDDDAHDSHGDDDARLDGHMWLDPDNAKILVKVLVERLSLLDPVHASIYAKNGEKTLIRLENLDRELKIQLETVKEKGFAVFHDAWQYFQKHYGLNQQGVVTLDSHTPPSVKHLWQLRKKLQDEKVVCIFSEPQSPSTLVAKLSEETGIASGVLDPKGSGLPLDGNLYFNLMTNIAKGLTQCLNPQLR